MKFVPFSEAIKTDETVTHVSISSLDEARSLADFTKLVGLEIRTCFAGLDNCLQEAKHLAGQLKSLRLPTAVLPPFLGKLRNLENLSFQMQYGQTLPPATVAYLLAHKDRPQVNLAKLEKLQSITGLWVGKLEEVGLVSFPKGITKIKTLRKLALKCNEASSWYRQFPELAQLEELSLIFIKHQDWITYYMNVIWVSMRDFQKLHTLDLKVFGIAGIRLPLSRDKQPKLKNLSVTGSLVFPANYHLLLENRLWGPPLSPYTLPKFSGEQILLFGFNYDLKWCELFPLDREADQVYLNYKNLKEIPKTIFTLKNLEVLNARSNYLRYIPAEIVLLDKLEMCNFNENELKNEVALRSVLKLCRKLRNSEFSDEEKILQTALLIGNQEQLSRVKQSEEILIACLDSPHPIVCQKAERLFFEYQESDLLSFPKDDIRLMILGWFRGNPHHEIQTKLQRIGVQTTEKLSEATHVLLGQKPGAQAKQASKMGLTFVKLDELKEFWERHSDSYISSRKSENAEAIANLKRLLTSEDPQNVEVALGIMLVEGIPPELLYIVFGCCIHHRTGSPFTLFARRVFRKHANSELNDILDGWQHQGGIDWEMLKAHPAIDFKAMIASFLYFADHERPFGYFSMGRSIKKMAEEMGLL